MHSRSAYEVKFGELSVSQRRGINEIYFNRGFPAYFRERIDAQMCRYIQQWQTCGINPISMQFPYLLKSVPEFEARFRSDEPEYVRRFKKCVESEGQIRAGWKLPTQSGPSAPTLRPASAPVRELSELIVAVTQCRSTIEHVLLHPPERRHPETLRQLVTKAKTCAETAAKSFRQLMQQCRLRHTRNALLVVSKQSKPQEIADLDNDLNCIEVQAQAYVRVMYDLTELCQANGAGADVAFFESCIADVSKSTMFVVLQPSDDSDSDSGDHFSSQIIKEGVKFHFAVRLLTLPALKLQLHGTRSAVQEAVAISYDVVYDKDLTDLLSKPNQPPETAASFEQVKAGGGAKPKISNVSWKSSRYAKEQAESVTVHFENMRLAKVKSVEADEQASGRQATRSESPESLSDDGPKATSTKCAVLVTVRINLKNSAPLLIRTHSIALILITHVKLKCAAWRTLFWHDAFCPAPNQPAPQQVPWATFIAALQRWFSARTGRELQDEHMDFVRRCILDTGDTVACKSMWKQPSRKIRGKIPIRMPFWRHFYTCTMTIAEYDEIRSLWQAGLLYGFVSNDDAYELLRRFPGNALLRFSNTKRSSALVIVLSQLSESNPNSVCMCCLEPLEKKEQLLEVLTVLGDIDVQYIVPNRDWKQLLNYNPSEQLGPVSEVNKADYPVTPYVSTFSQIIVPHTENWPVRRPLIASEPTVVSNDTNYLIARLNDEEIHYLENTFMHMLEDQLA